VFESGNKQFYENKKHPLIIMQFALRKEIESVKKKQDIYKNIK
jgi:hypothetical protein